MVSYAYKCTKDCTYVGMVNCANIYCASDAQQCQSGLATISTDILIGGLEAALSIFSLGIGDIAVDVARDTIMKTTETIGTQAIQGSFKMLKTFFNNPDLKKQFSDMVVSKVKATLDARWNIADSTIANVCSTVEAHFTGSLSTAQSPGQIALNIIDVFGIHNLTTYCNGSYPTADPNLCAKAVISAISLFDPTGILALLSTVIEPLCEFI